MDFNVSVLLVDDDEAVGEITAELLAKCGCRTTRVSNGDVAVRHAIDSPFDVIFVDIAMPAPSGVEVLRRVRKERGDQKVVFITGYSPEEIGHLLDSKTWLLPKPYSTSVIRGLLECIFPHHSD